MFQLSRFLSSTFIHSCLLQTQVAPRRVDQRVQGDQVVPRLQVDNVLVAQDVAAVENTRHLERQRGGVVVVLGHRGGRGARRQGLDRRLGRRHAVPGRVGGGGVVAKRLVDEADGVPGGGGRGVMRRRERQRQQRRAPDTEGRVVGGLGGAGGPGRRVVQLAKQAADELALHVHGRGVPLLGVGLAGLVQEADNGAVAEGNGVAGEALQQAARRVHGLVEREDLVHVAKVGEADDEGRVHDAADAKGQPGRRVPGLDERLEQRERADGRVDAGVGEDARRLGRRPRGRRRRRRRRGRLPGVGGDALRQERPRQEHDGPVEDDLEVRQAHVGGAALDAVARLDVVGGQAPGEDGRPLALPRGHAVQRRGRDLALLVDVGQHLLHDGEQVAAGRVVVGRRRVARLLGRGRAAQQRARQDVDAAEGLPDALAAAELVGGEAHGHGLEVQAEGVGGAHGEAEVHKGGVAARGGQQVHGDEDVGLDGQRAGVVHEVPGRQVAAVVEARLGHLAQVLGRRLGAEGEDEVDDGLGQRQGDGVPGEGARDLVQQHGLVVQVEDAVGAQVELAGKVPGLVLGQGGRRLVVGSGVEPGRRALGRGLDHGRPQRIVDKGARPLGLPHQAPDRLQEGRVGRVAQVHEAALLVEDEARLVQGRGRGRRVGNVNGDGRRLDRGAASRARNRAAAVSSGMQLGRPSPVLRLVSALVVNSPLGAPAAGLPSVASLFAPLAPAPGERSVRERDEWGEERIHKKGTGSGKSILYGSRRPSNVMLQMSWDEQASDGGLANRLSRGVPGRLLDGAPSWSRDRKVELQNVG
ncbi:hypothetical protein VCV18_006021 [Metarhizium anisopliae]